MFIYIGYWTLNIYHYYNNVIIQLFIYLREKEDSLVAQQVMNETMVAEEKERVAREINDQVRIM